MVLLLGLLIDNHVDVVGTKQITLLSLDHAKQITEAALVLVLFFGGLTTNWQSVRGVIKPAGRLATVGVLMTAALITLVALGFGLAQARSRCCHCCRNVCLWERSCRARTPRRCSRC